MDPRGPGRTPPPDDAYERVTDAKRFEPLHRAARDLIASLEREYLVHVDVGVSVAPAQEGMPYLDAARLVPDATDASTLTVALTSFPGVYLWYGRFGFRALPSCGCDACAEDVTGELETLEDTVAYVVAGTFTEERTGRGRRTTHWTARGGGEAWRPSARGSDEPERGTFTYRPWTRRSPTPPTDRNQRDAPPGAPT